MDAPTTRRATLDDLDALVGMRVALMREMGEVEADDEASLAEAIRRYLATELPAGRFLGWVAKDGDGAVIACGGLVFLQKPPSPRNHSGREAYIMNIYTVPSWRGRGLGSQLFAAIVAETRESGAGLIRLHATEDGRAIYERGGFRAVGTEMVLHLSD